MPSTSAAAKLAARQPSAAPSESTRSMDLPSASAAAGLLDGAPGRGAAVGGRDSICLLDVGRSARAARRAARRLRAARRRGRRDGHCRSLCARLRVPLEVAGAGARGGQPPGLGARGPLRRGARARPRARRRRWRAGHTADRPGRDRSSTGWRRRRAAARCSGWAALDGRLVRPLLGVTRGETRRGAAPRPGVARRPRQRGPDRYARGRVRGPAAGAAAVDPRRRAQRRARRAAAARGGRGARAGRRHRAGRPRRRSASTTCAALPPAVARLVLRRLAEDAAGRRARAIRARWRTSSPSDAGALDLGDGARAVVADGVLRFERHPAADRSPPRLPQPACATPDRRDPRPARRAQAPRRASSARRSRATTPTATCCWSACSRARSSSWPT